MDEREVRHLALLLAAGPFLAMVVVRLFAVEGLEGLFQTSLAGLVCATGLAALGVRKRRLLLVAGPASALLCSILHLVLGGTLAGAGTLLWLMVASMAAATGLAGVGRALGAPWLTAGALSAGVLWVAMTALFWVDGMSERLPQEQRFEFKQAAMQIDLATAAAYGMDFDRFHAPAVYRDLPIASSIIAAPSAGKTGGLWLVMGFVTWSLALLLDRRS